MTTATSQSFRPLSLAEILDQAIRLYRRNFARFIGIIALVQVPLAVFSLLITVFGIQPSMAAMVDFSETNPTEMPNFGPWAISMLLGLLMTFLNFVLVYGMGTAAVTRAISDDRMGQQPGVFEAYRRIGKSWVSILGAMALVGLLSIALAIWLIIPCVGWLSGFGMLAFLATVITPLIAPVVVVEHKGAAAALRRAWELARRRFWWVLGFMAVLYLLNMVIVTGPTLLITFLMTSFGGAKAAGQVAGQPSTLSLALNSLVSLVSGVLYLPLQLTAVTLMYFDLRVRTEGLDLALQTGGEQQTATELTLLAAEAPAAEGKLLTRQEFVNFVLLTILGGMVYLLFTGAVMALGFLVSMGMTGGL